MHPQLLEICQTLQGATDRYAGYEFHTARVSDLEDTICKALQYYVDQNIVRNYRVQPYRSDGNDDPDHLPVHTEITLKYPGNSHEPDNVIIQIDDAAAYVYVLFVNDVGEGCLEDDVVIENDDAKAADDQGDPADAWDRSMRGM